MKNKFIQNDNNMAIAYYRYSSEKQNDASIEQQQTEAHKYAEQKGLTIVKEYIDRAQSATNDKREQFQLMLSEVHTLKPNGLIVWKSDRIARNKEDAVINKAKIRSAGCQIYSIKEPSTDDIASNIILESIYDALNEVYSLNLRDNVLRGMNNNAQKGLYNGVTILGYTGEKGQRYKIDEYMAPVIRQIFMDYSSGKSMPEICDELNNKGYRTSRGNLFKTSSLSAILKNRAYIGEYKYSDVVIRDGMPAIVSKELFEKVQKKLKENKRFGAKNKKGREDSGAPRYWLTGKLYCGLCKSTMQGVSGTSGTKGKKYYYYACNKQHKRNGNCNKKSIRKELLEDMVSWLITNTILTNKTFRTAISAEITSAYNSDRDNKGIIASLKKELSITEKSIQNIISAIVAGASGETINNELNELEERKKQIHNAIIIEESKDKTTLSEVQSFFDKYLNVDISDPVLRETIMDHYVDSIFVDNDELTIEFKCDYIKRVEAKDNLSNSITEDLIDGYLPPIASMPILEEYSKKKRKGEVKQKVLLVNNMVHQPKGCYTAISCSSLFFLTESDLPKSIINPSIYK